VHGKTAQASGIIEKLKEGFLVRFQTFDEIRSALEEIFSPKAMSVILYTVAIKCGKGSCNRVMKKVKTKEEAINHLCDLKREENWGKLSFQNVDLENGSGTVIVVDSFETTGRKTDEPCCHLLRGFLEGFLSELFKKSIMVSEEKCAGRGDEHCEFVFK